MIQRILASFVFVQLFFVAGTQTGLQRPLSSAADCSEWKLWIERRGTHERRSVREFAALALAFPGRQTGGFFFG